MQVTMWHPGRGARIEELCDDVDEIRTFDDAIIRTRRATPHAILFTLYGPHVLDYITRSLTFRATDPASHVNNVTIELFTRVFGHRHILAFNQLVKLDKRLLVPKLKQLVKEGYTMERFVNEYENDPDGFVTAEIDATIHLDAGENPRRRVEIKLFTCPDGSCRVLAGHLRKAALQRLFATRDFLGFITFASIHDAGNPNLPPRYNNEVPERMRTGWFLHLAIVDARVMGIAGTATSRADALLDEMRRDHAFIAGKLNLNTHACSIDLITNYVKVIHMSYVIEKLKRDLEASERRCESERCMREEERSMREEERRMREEERRLREESEREKQLLLKALKDAGIPSPLDEHEKS